MTTGQDGFDFLASIPAKELERLRRRGRFLEIALVQLMRDERQLKEWFSASELAAMRLASLPLSRRGIARLAEDQEWESRISQGSNGEQRLYHFSALPKRAFENFIDLILKDGLGMKEEAFMPDGAAKIEERALPRKAKPRGQAQSPTGNATPQWVLPLLRLMRGGLALEDAVDHLRQAAERPEQTTTLPEARQVLRDLGLLRGMG